MLNENEIENTVFFIIIIICMRGALRHSMSQRSLLFFFFFFNWNQTFSINVFFYTYDLVFSPMFDRRLYFIKSKKESWLRARGALYPLFFIFVYIFVAASSFAFSDSLVGSVFLHRWENCILDPFFYHWLFHLKSLFTLIITYIIFQFPIAKVSGSY